MASQPLAYSEELDAAELRALARRCRGHADTVSSYAVRKSLLEMARDYEQRAAKLEAAG